MAVTVIRGTLGREDSRPQQVQYSQPSSVSQNPPQQDQIQQSIRAASSAAAASNIATDAAVSLIRDGRSSQRGERVRDDKKAKQIADSIADRIKKSDSSVDAHSDLSPVNARQHFSAN